MVRHTLVWALRPEEHEATTDCEAWSDDGAVHVRLKRNGDSDVMNDFPDSAEAVRRAMDFEQSLIAQGWEEVV